jgi:hypothetical protein
MNMVSCSVSGRLWTWVASGATLLIAVPAMASEALVSIKIAAPNGKVMRYDAVTGAVMPAPGILNGGTEFIGPNVPGGNGGLGNPYDMRLGTDGNIYVVSQSTNSVKKYDGTTGQYISDFVTAGSGGLTTPWGMQFGPDGNLYVASNATNQILRYNGTTGAFMDVFVSAGSGGLSTPRGFIFGNDQYRGSCGVGTAQDGYPELYVAGFGAPSGIYRYNGLTGAFVDLFDSAPGGQFIDNMFYEQVYVRNAGNYNTLANGNLLASFDSGTLNIYSGALSQADGPPCGGFVTNFNGFFNGPTCRGSMAFGPHRVTLNPANDDKQKKQSIYWPDYFGLNIRVVSANEQDCGNLVAIGGGGNAVSMLIKCGRNPGTTIRKVVQNTCLQGTVCTVRLQGDNMAGITGATLKRMRLTGGGDIDALDGPTIVGSNVQMSGNDVLIDFDTTNAEAGRYGILPTDSCSNAMNFPDVVLIYMPTLTNGDFEQGYVADREGQFTCNNVGANGNKSRPKHWDEMKGGQFGTGSQNQFDIHRDGNVWTPCDNSGSSIGGLHYGSIQSNFTNDDWHGMYQTIAAPHVVGQTSTQAYDVYIDADVASFEGFSPGKIRLYDGDNYGGNVIAETTINNTQQANGNVFVRSANFRATVPQGYTYGSNPPILTIAFILQSVPGDQTPTLALKGFHIDNVRNQPIPCSHSPWADADNDGDVDSDDYAVFQKCYSGPGAAPATPACACVDRNTDGKVNETDFAAFVSCRQGPGVPVPPVGSCQ